MDLSLFWDLSRKIQKIVSCCKKRITKAAENVVEVIEIIISLFQHCLVANGDVDLSVRVCHCAGAERQNRRNKGQLLEVNTVHHFVTKAMKKLQKTRVKG